MNKTSIEWVRTYDANGGFTEGYSVNPIRFRPHGSDRTVTMCQLASPGCVHCYSATINQRFWPKSASVPFPGFTAAGVSSGEFVLDNKQLLSVLKIKVRAKVFWCDMCDIFLKEVPDEMIDACFAVAALSPHLTHMFLTKRPERMLDYLTGSDVCSSIVDAAFEIQKDRRLQWEWPLPNVMLGASAENQKYFDERIGYIDKLHHIKWKMFLSLEPLIGPIDVEYPKSFYPHGAPMCCNGTDCGCRGMPTEPPMIYAADLAIVGGESGPGARPMQSNWAGAIQQACQRWKIAYFHKQNGMFVDAGHEEFGQLPSGRYLYCDSQGRILSDEEVKASTEDSDVTTMKWVGRERAGKTLYGKTYHEFPA